MGMPLCARVDPSTCLTRVNATHWIDLRSKMMKGAKNQLFFVRYPNSRFLCNLLAQHMPSAVHLSLLLGASSTAVVKPRIFIIFKS
jgi:hypothetical protein